MPVYCNSTEMELCFLFTLDLFPYQLPARSILSSVTNLIVSLDRGCRSWPLILVNNSPRKRPQGMCSKFKCDKNLSCINSFQNSLKKNYKSIIDTLFLIVEMNSIAMFFVNRADTAYRFIYFNHMNLAQKTTVHSDMRKTGSNNIPPETLKLLTDISSDMSKYDL